MKKWIIAACVFFAVLATSWSLLNSGFFRVHDYTHAARISELLRSLQDGHFPVRWTKDFGFGYGMPLFEFYAPLPYYVGALLYWLGLDIIVVIKVLFIVCSLFTCVGMFLFGKKILGTTAGILSAVALTVAPYRALNLFVRGALSEAWGLMALPWILLGIVKVVRGEKKGWVVLTISLIVLFLSHNITTLLFLPISVLFGIGYWACELLRQHALLPSKKTITAYLKKTPAMILKIGWGYVLAVGVSAFYLFPSLAEKDYTRVGIIFTGYFRYVNHFLYFRQFFEDRWGYGGSAPWPYNGISFFLGYGHFFGLLVAIVLLAFFVFSFLRKNITKKPIELPKAFLYYCGLFLMILVLLVFTLFMTTYKSQPIWDALPIMIVVQFPWRWLSISSVLLATLVGFSSVLVRRKLLRIIYAGILICFLLVSNANFFRPEFYLQDPVKFYYTDPNLIRIYMSQVLNDYVPKQVPALPKAVLQSASTRSKYGTVQVLVDKVDQKLFKTSFSQPDQLVEVFTADFPGWKIFVDGNEIKKTLGPNGDFLVKMPAGEHMLGIQLTDTPVRYWSDTLSAISGIVLLGFLLTVIPITKKKIHVKNTA